VAVMVDVPAVIPKATALLGSMVATVVVPELQVTGLTGGWVVPLLNFSIAVKRVVVPVEMVIVAGVITSVVVGGVPTVRVAFPTVMPSQLVAVMVVEPGATAVALPVLSIVATLLLVLAHVTWLETSRALEPPAAKVKLPIATKGWLAPIATLAVRGLRVIELS
jgi:hypothetical protein